MDLTKITEADFMCDPWGYCPDQYAHDAVFANCENDFDATVGPMIWHLGDGYTIHESLTCPGDATAVFHGVFVGFYIGEMLAVRPDHFGKKLGPALALATAPARGMPERRKVTPKGNAALRRAWRYANGMERPPWDIPSWIAHVPFREDGPARIFAGIG